MLKGMAHIFSAETLVLPTGMVTAIFLARYLGPAGYGIFALVSQLVIWLEQSSAFGLTDSTIRFVSGTKKWERPANTFLFLYLATGLMLAAFFQLAAPLLSKLFQDPDMTAFFRLFALDTPFYCLSLGIQYVLAGRHRFRDQAFMSAVYWTSRMILIILFVLGGMGIQGAVLGSITASCIQMIAGCILLRPRIGAGFLKVTKHLMGFIAPLSAAIVFLRLFRMELFMIKALGASAAFTGYYGAALNLSMTPFLFSKSLSPPLLSICTHLLDDQKTDSARLMARTAIRSLFWLVPLFTGAVSLSPELIRLIFGSHFMPAVPVFQILMPAAYGLMIIRISFTLFVAMGKPGWTFFIAFPMVPLAFTAHLIMIPRIGSIGAAVVTAAFAMLGGIIALAMCLSVWSLRFPLGTLSKCVGIAVLVHLFCVMWPISGVLIFVKILLVIAISISGLILFREFSAAEIRSLNNWLLRRSVTGNIK